MMYFVQKFHFYGTEWNLECDILLCAELQCRPNNEIIFTDD